MTRGRSGLRHWLGGGVILLTPMVLAGILAWQASVQAHRDKAEILADVVLERAAETTQQIDAGFAGLSTLDAGAPCSALSIERMRTFDVGSSMLQGFGFVSGSELVCSSFHQTGSLDVGPPDYISAAGYPIRRNRVLALAPETPLLIVGSVRGYVAFVHPALIFVLTRTDDYRSGIVSISGRMPMVISDPLDLDWTALRIPSGQARGVAWQGHQLVAWTRSPHWDHFAYAAVSLDIIVARAWDLAAILLPVGLCVGIGAVWLWRRMRAARGALPALLRAGLQRGEVSLVYQPIVDLATGRWAGAEALARWRRPDGEMVSPDIFVAIAERHGLIERLTDHVIATAVEDMAPFLRRHRGAFISLNISAIDLMRADLVSILAQAAAQERLPRNAIHLEITERESVDTDRCAATIQALRGHGFMVGSDDFGVGYSNLAYLDSLKLDFLKIDRAFVTNAFRGAPHTELVDHIIGLARSRSLQMVAEGVERADQRDALRQRGVHFAQGWLFAKPLAAAEFRAWFAAQDAAQDALQDAPPSAVNEDAA